VNTFSDGFNRRSLVFVVFFFLSTAAWTQDNAQISEPGEVLPATEDKDSVRRYYIKGFPDYFFLYPVLKQRSLNFELSRSDRSSVLTFKPNNTYSMGMGLYMFELGVELAFAIPLKERSIERFGESRARDIQLNVLAKRWGVDAFYQRYVGFYIVDNNNEPRANEPFPQRSDIGTRNFGITGHYVFNHQKFSFRSAYNYSERQLFSKGSVLLFGTLNTFRVAGDSSIVSNNQLTAFGNEVDFLRLRYTTFSLAPGYTFTFTYNHFFLNATLALGPAHHWINYDLERDPSSTYDIAINSFFGARLAIGYNGYRLFGGATLMSQGSTLKFDDVNFSNSNTVFKILVGYRFAEFAILKKRVWDLLPFDI
jgi:hypothetical protein